MTDNQLLSAIYEKITGMDERFDQIETHLGGIDERFDQIETHLGGIDERLTVVEEHLDGIDERLTVVEEHLDGIDERLTVVEEHLDGIDEQVSVIGVINKRLDCLEKIMNRNYDLTLEFYVSQKENNVDSAERVNRIKGIVDIIVMHVMKGASELGVYYQ